MTLLGRLGVPFGRNIQVLLNAAAKFIGLRHIELCVGIALGRWIAPLLYRFLEFTAAPGIDTIFHISKSRRGHGQGESYQAGREQAAHNVLRS